jgi:predicted metal-dependent HD superfamily phosphohydrolase
MTTSADLMQRWNTLAARSGLRDASGLGQELLARYGEPQRVYHAPAHLAQVLALLEEMDAEPRLHLAAWFHDAVYQPGDPRNESLSAELARTSLAACGCSIGDQDFVAAAVLATASHRASRPEFAPLLDADLAILGAAPEDYRHYCEAIRREHQAVPEAAFRQGRTAFLRAVLARPHIFETVFGKERFEQAARLNLAAELAALEAKK